MDKIQLRLVNRSQDVNNTRYVIFQNNVTVNYGELPIAWKVVQNLGIGDYHPFNYPLVFQVGAVDAFGNHTPEFTVNDGEAYDMVRAQSGDQLQRSSRPASSPTEVQVRNQLPQSSISARCIRDGKLLARKTNISPGQMAVFEFKPRIFIGAVSQVEEGEVIDSAILQQVNTEIDLLGISSADIVVTGGGGGTESQPFRFSLTNVV